MARMLTLLFLFGCGNGSAQQLPSRPKPASAPARFPNSPLAADPPPTPAQPPEPEQAVGTLHVASFQGDQLDECTDFELRSPDRSAIDLMLREVRKAAKSTELKRPCAEQFAGRIVLASCTILQTFDEDGTRSTRIASSYFNVATAIDSDAYMRQCLERNGDWSAAPQDGHAITRERLRQELSGLRSAVRSRSSSSRHD